MFTVLRVQCTPTPTLGTLVSINMDMGIGMGVIARAYSYVLSESIASYIVIYLSNSKPPLHNSKIQPPPTSTYVSNINLDVSDMTRHTPGRVATRIPYLRL